MMKAPEILSDAEKRVSVLGNAMEREPESPAWAIRLAELVRALGLPQDAAVRERCTRELWLIINSVLYMNLRIHSRRMPSVRGEDIEDIRGEKSLELVIRAESGKWDLDGRHPKEIAGFLAAVARNGLSDLLSKQGRQVPLPDESAAPVDLANRDPVISHVPDPPNVPAERRAYVEALLACAARLDKRTVSVWFLRVLCDLSSKEIAAHPDVGLKPAHVDVLLHRARGSMRACMQGKGLSPGDMPPGCFAALWQALRARGMPRP